MTIQQPKSHYNMDNATLIDAANHLAWLLDRMATRLENATTFASPGEQKADAINLRDEMQPLVDALKNLGFYRPDGQCAPKI